MTELLRVEHVHKTYRTASFFERGAKVPALTDVSFSLKKGEIVGLVGASGCGKSTLGKIILRIEGADSGKVWLEGRDVFSSESRASFDYRAQVQMIFQDPFGSLNPAHTIAYHIERPLLRHGFANRKNVHSKVIELLEQVGLRPAQEIAKAYPFALSGGQRQRVAIARALAVNPKLIIADEPTSMLDVSIRMDVLNLLDKLRRERDLGILLITHDIASARYLTDRLLVLNKGVIVESGPTEDVIGQPQNAYTRLLLDAIEHPTSSAALS